jgi:hypothetical protein
VLNLHSYANANETKEWVAPKLNKMQTILPSKGIVLVATLVAFASASTSPGGSEHTLT